MLFHGGFWRRRGGDLDLMEPLAERLVDSGYAVWNVEYGRTGEKFGGWPFTFEHVSASVAFVDELADGHQLDPSRIVLVGHSAGGHLALWASTQHRVDGVVALAPIVDLNRAYTDRLGNNAVGDLLGGGPLNVPDRYLAASVEDLGTTPALIVTSSTDESVPAVYSREVVGDHVRVHRVDGIRHLDMIHGEGLAADLMVTAVEEFSGGSE